MNFDRASFLSCLVRPKGKPKPQDKADDLPKHPDIPVNPARNAPPERTLLPYEHPPTGPSSFTKMPPDVILLFVDLVDILTKYRVMKTCRYTRHVLEPTLYQHLMLLEPDLYRRSYWLHECLVKKSSLISQIITYHGPLFPPKPKTLFKAAPSQDVDDEVLLRVYSDVKADERWKRAVAIFLRANRIRDLCFIDFVDWVQSHAWAQLRIGVESMRLGRLVVQVRTAVDVLPILRTQPDLTHLELLWGAEGCHNLEPTDIPKLKYLSATLDIAALVVPGRPVEEINLLPSQGNRSQDQTLLEFLSLSSCPIRRLGFKLYNIFNEDAVRDALQAVSRTLTDVEELTITVGGRISSRLLILEIPAFPSIRTLTLLDATLDADSDLYHSNNLLPGTDSWGTTDLKRSATWADVEARLKETCQHFTTLSHTSLNYLRWKS